MSFYNAFQVFTGRGGAADLDHARFPATENPAFCKFYGPAHKRADRCKFDHLNLSIARRLTVDAMDVALGARASPQNTAECPPAG